MEVCSTGNSPGTAPLPRARQTWLGFVTGSSQTRISLPKVTSGTGQMVLFQLNIQQQLFLTFLCINSCQLALFATQDCLPHNIWVAGQWSLNGWKYSQGFTQKGRQSILPRPGALSHCHYLQLHKKSPHLCMLLFWRVRSWLCKYEFIHSTLFFFFKLICKSWIILCYC